MVDADVIVIGSGPAGVHAALALVEQGKRVTMLDGGVEAPAILRELTEDFLAMRRARADQWRWFLGEDCSAIPVDGLRGGLGGGMTSGNRAFVTRSAAEHMPLHMPAGLEVTQSLASGGLGAVWGATCVYMDDVLLASMGLPIGDTRIAYREITQIIGVSGPPSEHGAQPPFPVDHHTTAFLRRYERDSAWWRRAGLSVRLAHAAILTQALDGRQPTSGGDMDYYSDAGASVYRPASTLVRLQASPLFTLIRDIVADAVRDEGDTVAVHCHTRDHARTVRTFRARRLVVAAGAIGTGALLARSFGVASTPLFLKPHAFIAGLHLGAVGKAGPERRISSCQAILGDLGDDPAGWCAHLYGYRSMLLFRLLPSLPLPVPLALRIARDMSSALVVADVRFGSVAPNASLRFDSRAVCIAPDAPGEGCDASALRAARRGLRRLGVLPLRTMPLALGSSSHYAGTTPIGGDGPLGTDADGVLRASSNIVVADAALFRALPPQPHTLTIMATARRIGTALARRMAQEAR